MNRKLIISLLILPILVASPIVIASIQGLSIYLHRDGSADFAYNMEDHNSHYYTGQLNITANFQQDKTIIKASSIGDIVEEKTYAGNSVTVDLSSGESSSNYYMNANIVYKEITDVGGVQATIAINVNINKNTLQGELDANFNINGAKPFVESINDTLSTTSIRDLNMWLMKNEMLWMKVTKFTVTSSVNDKNMTIQGKLVASIDLVKAASYFNTTTDDIRGILDMLNGMKLHVHKDTINIPYTADVELSINVNINTILKEVAKHWNGEIFSISSGDFTETYKNEKAANALRDFVNNFEITPETPLEVKINFHHAYTQYYIHTPSIKALDTTNPGKTVIELIDFMKKYGIDSDLPYELTLSYVTFIPDKYVKVVNATTGKEVSHGYLNDLLNGKIIVENEKPIQHTSTTTNTGVGGSTSPSSQEQVKTVTSNRNSGVQSSELVFGGAAIVAILLIAAVALYVIKK